MVVCILDFQLMAVTVNAKRRKYSSFKASTMAGYVTLLYVFVSAIITVHNIEIIYHFIISTCSNKVFAHDPRLKLAIFIVKSVPVLSSIFHWVK